MDYERVLELDSALIGSPQRVVEKLTRMHSQFGLENCLLWLNRGGLMPQREVLRSMETIARDVFPAVAHLGSGISVPARG